jgi:hypothetical protein
MLIESPFRYLSRTWNVIPTLFLFLLIVQIMDVHSTLTAGGDRYETNRVINWISQWIGFAGAVCVIKIGSVSMLGFLYRVWRRSGGSHDREFVLCLSLIAVFYSVVLANNYLF